MLRMLLYPLAPLVALSLIMCAVFCAYTLVGIAPSPLAQMLSTVGWALLLLIWMDIDARHRRCVPCFDFGYLACLTFPVSLVWYCLWSRGWRGMLMVGILVGLYLGPWLVATVVWAIKWGHA